MRLKKVLINAALLFISFIAFVFFWIYLLQSQNSILRRNDAVEMIWSILLALISLIIFLGLVSRLLQIKKRFWKEENGLKLIYFALIVLMFSQIAIGIVLKGIYYRMIGSPYSSCDYYKGDAMNLCIKEVDNSIDNGRNLQSKIKTINSVIDEMYSDIDDLKNRIDDVEIKVRK